MREADQSTSPNIGQRLRMSGSIPRNPLYLSYHSQGQPTPSEFYMIYIFNRNWFDTRWQQYITHLHTNNTHNTEKGKLERAGRAPSLRVIPWHLP
jgi:hypothetical protein